MLPADWARENRVHPPHSGYPGPRDPGLTPYIIDPTRAMAEGIYRRTVFVCGAQMGKTEGFMDVIGERFDRAPVPMIYVGPSREFNREQFEPRLMELIDSAETLSGKLARGKRSTKTRKVISGVPLRIASGGSSKALKSDPAGIGMMDEVDEMLANVAGAGNPIGLLEARGFTHSDFILTATSTPSVGAVGIDICPETGLHFWAPAPGEDLISTIWRMWQEGTRHHFAWPCPHCGEYFIPRASCLYVPPGSTPAEARRLAVVRCPRPDCDGFIDEDAKEEANDRGRYVAPGQTIDLDGTVRGDPPESDCISFWASGLCSPFVSIGKRAEALLKAELSADPYTVMTCTNAHFGELYAPGGGDVPEWKEVRERKGTLKRGEVPADGRFATLAIDVQANRLVYAVRVWGPRATSWLIDHGELFGDLDDEGEAQGTAALPIWDEASELLLSTFGGMPIRRCFIDSGFRPGKPTTVPVNRVYDWCQRHRRLAFPTKGKAQLGGAPLRVIRPDVTRSGSLSKRGLSLILLDTDHWKSWVHERVRWPGDAPGAWHLHDEVDDDYCRQIVSEARLRKPSGEPEWVRRSRDNHFLDVEAMGAACGHMLSAHRIADPQEPIDEEPDAEPPAAASVPAPPRPQQPRRGYVQSGRRGRGGWMR